MSTPTPNPTAALSELDRLGQGLLDALYAEAKVATPEVKNLIRSARANPGGGRDILAQLGAIVGGGEKEGIDLVLNGMKFSYERQAAQDQYVAIRKAYEAAGLI